MISDFLLSCCCCIASAFNIMYMFLTSSLHTCRANISQAPLMRLGDVSPSSPTIQPQSIEEIFEEIFGDNSDPIFTTSQVDVDDDDDQPGYSQSASLSTNLSTTKSSKIFAGYTGKSSKSKSIKTSKSSSKSSKGDSYPSLEGKADKWGDDPSLLLLEKMGYKVGNGGRIGGRRDLLMLMMTSITVSSYLVWQ